MKFIDLVKGGEISGITELKTDNNEWTPDYDYFTTSEKYLCVFKNNEMWQFEYCPDTGGWMAIEKYISQTSIDIFDSH
jgi:hypothetical protein